IDSGRSNVRNVGTEGEPICWELTNWNAVGKSDCFRRCVRPFTSRRKRDPGGLTRTLSGLQGGNHLSEVLAHGQLRQHGAYSRDNLSSPQGYEVLFVACQWNRTPVRTTHSPQGIGNEDVLHGSNRIDLQILELLSDRVRPRFAHRRPAPGL